MNIEAAGIDHVLPFIRLCALLQFHLFNDVLPSLSTPVWSSFAEFAALYCMSIHLILLF